MIQVNSLHITEVRGIRDLTIEPMGSSVIITGPNGSGKSGVVDAVEFALTGDMSRLSGTGTGGVSVGRHGPHVDKRDDPSSATVSLGLVLLKSGKAVTLIRSIRNPREFVLDPDDPQLRAEVIEAISRPELVLSRREIIKYVVTEPGQRSKDVQALLRLAGIHGVSAGVETP